MRAGYPGGIIDGANAFQSSLYNPSATAIDAQGNVYIADDTNNRIRFIAKKGGTYFGQSMAANCIYTIAGNGTGGYLADNVSATSTMISSPKNVSVDARGNVYIADGTHRIRFIAKTGGTYFGQSMTANYIYTIAGNGSSGYLADNVSATSTRIFNPYGVSVDTGGNVYIADAYNHRIRFIPQTGGTYFGQSMTANYIYTIAGNGTGGYLADNVSATNTRINIPSDVGVDVGGNVYIADTSNHRIRFIAKLNGTYFGQNMTANYIYTIAGNGTGGYLADNVSATSTRINNPYGVNVDAGGNVYIADAANHRIRFIPKTDGTYFGQSMTANYIYTIAGNGTGGYLADNVSATNTRINSPNDVSVDPGGNVYIADKSNYRIRFLAKNGGTCFGKLMTANYIYTIAGNGAGGYLADDVLATSTLIYYPTGVSVDAGGNLYITDNYNHRIRFTPKTGGTYFGQSMTANYIYTIAGNGTSGYLGDNVSATNTRINYPNGVSVDAGGNVYVADYGNHRIRFIPQTGGTYFGQSMTANYIYTIAGNGTGGYLADNVSATNTRINNPNGVSVDAGGNVYVADYGNHRIRFIPKTDGTYFGQSMTANYIYTIAGNGSSGYLGDNVTATNTRINNPYGVSVDAGGNVYVADYGNHRIRFIPQTDGTYFGQSMTANYIYTIAGNGTSGYLADNVSATGTRIKNPTGVSVDAGRNVYVADYGNHRIRFIAKTGGTCFGQSMTANYIYTITGNGTAGYDGENATATSKKVNNPVGIFATSTGTAYIADSSNNKIRMIAAEDFIGPSTSTLTAAAGSTNGKVDLSWFSAGDNNVNLGNLTGSYRIQYATYTATWLTGSTPANATTLTISTTNATPGVAVSTTVSGLSGGTTYYFALFTGDEIPNWSDVSNTTSAIPPSAITLTEAVGQPGWIGQGETQRILGTAQVVSDSNAGVTVSSVSLTASGYTADGNLTNVEVWLSSSGYIDANAIRLENTAKAFSSNAVAFTQSVTISTTPYYLVARADVAAGAAGGTFELTLRVHTTAGTVNNPISFANATDVVAPPNGAPSGLTATAQANLLQINLSWADNSSNEDYFCVYRATHAGVSSADYLIGVSDTGSLADGALPPNQQMYYAVYAHNRAGASAASASANATSAGIDALTTANIYVRAGGVSSGEDGGMAFYGRLDLPHRTALDAEGNLYIADEYNRRVRFIPKKAGTYWGQSMSANFIYTIAGDGGTFHDGDNALATGKNIDPYGIKLDAEGNLYIADFTNNRIRFVAKTNGTYWGQSMTANYIYTIAGDGGTTYDGDGAAATGKNINGPWGVGVDAQGNLYIADFTNNRVRFVPKIDGTYWGQSMTATYIYTIAGDGGSAHDGDGAAATSKNLNTPQGVSLDAGGNLYIAEMLNNRIRFVPKSSGTYWGQSMTANYIYTIAGDGGSSYNGDNAAATGKSVYYPKEANLDPEGNLYITDNTNRIRFVPKTTGTHWGQSMTANYIYTIVGDGGTTYDGDGAAATSRHIYSPTGVALDAAGNLIISDKSNHRIRFVPKNGGGYWGQTMTANFIYTVVGGGAWDGDDGLAVSKSVYNPTGVKSDAEGNIYIADQLNNRVRFIPKTSGTYWGQSMTAHRIYTIAGDGGTTYDADGAAATSLNVNNPTGVGLDAQGNLYMADNANNRIRFVPKTNGTYWGQNMTANYLYTIAGDGGTTYDGDGAAATVKNINNPTGVGLDGEGNLYIADQANKRIRFVPKTTGDYWGQSMTANYIYTIAGSGGAAYDGDGAAATAKTINVSYGVGVDPTGNLFIASTNSHRIRFVPKSNGTYWGQNMTANYIYTIAGDGGTTYDGDNALATGKNFNFPSGVSLDAQGNLYLSDFGNNRVRFVPNRSGSYFGQSMTANYVYTLGGDGGTTYDGENAAATGKNISSPYGIHAGADHHVYLTDANNKIRMIAGEDFIAPSTSTLAVTAGLEQVTLSWNSAGDDNVNLGDLTGTYRIQYATFTAAWSTASTPTDATTVTLATTSVTPGSARSYTVTGLTAGPTYYFVLWTGDEIPNWSDISNTTSTIALAPIRSVSIISGNSQAFGSVMMGAQVVGTTGTVVLNDGTLLNTYALRASTLTVGSPWQIMDSTPAGPNGLVFYGVFDGDSAPVLGNFDVDDVIGPENRNSTSAQFSVAGSTTGVSVPAGETRTLWIRLDAPTTTTTLEEQTLRIEITAQPP